MGKISNILLTNSRLVFVFNFLSLNNNIISKFLASIETIFFVIRNEKKESLFNRSKSFTGLSIFDIVFFLFFSSYTSKRIGFEIIFFHYNIYLEIKILYPIVHYCHESRHSHFFLFKKKWKKITNFYKNL